MSKVEIIAALLRDWHERYNGVTPADLPEEALEEMAGRIVDALDAQRSPRRPYVSTVAINYTPDRTTRYAGNEPIIWDQPHARQAPVYEHRITCAVCGQPATLSTRSATSPATCERDACRETYHKRKNAERQKRWRESRKTNS